MWRHILIWCLHIFIISSSYICFAWYAHSLCAPLGMFRASSVLSVLLLSWHPILSEWEEYCDDQHMVPASASPCLNSYSRHVHVIQCISVTLCYWMPSQWLFQSVSVTSVATSAKCCLVLHVWIPKWLCLMQPSVNACTVLCLPAVLDPVYNLDLPTVWAWLTVSWCLICSGPDAAFPHLLPIFCLVISQYKYIGVFLFAIT